MHASGLAESIQLEDVTRGQAKFSATARIESMLQGTRSYAHMMIWGAKAITSPQAAMMLFDHVRITHQDRIASTAQALRTRSALLSTPTASCPSVIAASRSWPAPQNRDTTAAPGGQNARTRYLDAAMDLWSGMTLPATCSSLPIQILPYERSLLLAYGVRGNKQ